ncbi:hypothetical protein EN739_31615 [Mesorhizobium sp. M2A.F.Ca.ET.017.03.2.1]|uniref:hypothetical protein n=1 Tax=unclassified Mesorhizobium TaxID=325217 RepID=UPI000FCA2B93|nr:MULTISPECIES: hypothetical protein [unclassified Mesorhizobium]RUW39140.1 hypothetical protein EOA37_21050 [Mesorhizobium sp. M2A.F.Ca.ET.015.02.1.1]RVC90968.1 hypothetical protein EN739_31615 [Mesorhizobium sp. M2A.F.Ca.ET.017.03.2.1]
MAITVTSPATLFEMAELSGASSRLMWAVAREMWAKGSTFAIRDGDELVGLAGIYPMTPDCGEAWFNIRPTAARHMLAICRAIKLTLRSSGYREIVAVVGTDAGRRIAAAAGLTFFEATEMGEVWHDDALRGR